MQNEILGLHHVSTVSGQPGSTHDFYSRLLGQRLVKRTVNFDAPNGYHLYYGDRIGRPGTLLTYFPLASNRTGTRGAGEVDITHLAIPAGSLGYWASRLAAAGVDARPTQVGGHAAVSFADPDGMRLTLCESPGAANAEPWTGEVPTDHAIRGLAAVSVVVNAVGPTAEFLTGMFGFRQIEGDEKRAWFTPARRALSAALPALEVVAEPDLPPAKLGFGSVHHVAWRVPDADAQQRVLAALQGNVGALTEVRDRHYFTSIYFREPGGVIFEVATDGPGFTVDEPADLLGSSLKLPASMEKYRKLIEHQLPKF